MGASGRDRRKKRRITTLKRHGTLIGGILLLIGASSLIKTLRRAGLYSLRIDRALHVGDVHDIRLNRSESSIVDIVRDDPDNPLTPGETLRSVFLEGRAKLVNVDGRGVPTRVILKITELREKSNAEDSIVLLKDSSDIGVTRRVGGVFEIACKNDLSPQVEDALSFGLNDFMRPIPRDIRLNALILDEEERRLQDEWQLDSTQLKLYGAHLLGGTPKSAQGQAQLTRKDIIGGIPCLVLLTHSQFKGMAISATADYRSFAASSFKVSTAHSLPLDLRQPVVSKSITSVLVGKAQSRNSLAEARLTVRVKVITEID